MIEAFAVVVTKHRGDGGRSGAANNNGENAAPVAADDHHAGADQAKQ